MATDTLTLALNGTVPLDLFAQAVDHFSKMVQGLADDIVGPDKVEWEVERLASGSAIITARAYHASLDEVEQIIEAYHIVGRALFEYTAIPYSPEVGDNARALTALLNGKITSINFSTQDQSVEVSERVEELEEDGSDYRRQYSIGLIKGELSSITTRPRLKISLYDTLFDRAVTCYLEDEYREIIRKAWGQQIIITGLILRDPNTGRPVSIKDVVDIQIEANSPTGGYKRARGMFPHEPGDPLPEVLIGKLRDESE